MSVIGRTFHTAGRAVSGVAVAAADVVVAIGGAALNGVIGGVKGAADGVQRGLGTSSTAVPAAALAVVAVGAAGLVDWPILLAVGGSALVLQRIGRAGNEESLRVAEAQLKAVTNRAPDKAVPKTSRRAARKAPGRRAGTA